MVSPSFAANKEGATTPQPIKTTTLDSEIISERIHATDSQALLLGDLEIQSETILVHSRNWRVSFNRPSSFIESKFKLWLVVGYIVDFITNEGADVTCSSREKPIPSVEDETVFDPEIFFYVLLPPIIFYAGYDMKQKQFFRNLGTILLFAFAGTTIMCFVSGGMFMLYTQYIGSSHLTINESFLYGAIISATDTAIFHDLHVDERLHALVFGESALNDAVAIVVYRSISEYKPDLGPEKTASQIFYSVWMFLLIFVGSLACGMFLAMITSTIFKFSDIKRFPLLETTIFVLLSYASFVTGEALSLSGI
eukprot:gene3090-8195_t